MLRGPPSLGGPMSRASREGSKQRTALESEAWSRRPESLRPPPPPCADDRRPVPARRHARAAARARSGGAGGTVAASGRDDDGPSCCSGCSRWASGCARATAVRRGADRRVRDRAGHDRAHPPASGAARGGRASRTMGGSAGGPGLTERRQGEPSGRSAGGEAWWDGHAPGVRRGVRRASGGSPRPVASPPPLYENHVSIGVVYTFRAIYNWNVNTRFGSGI